MGESVLTPAGIVLPPGGIDPRQAELLADAGLCRDRDGALLLDGIQVAGIARYQGTPAYVYNAAVIRRRFEELAAALAPLDHRINYAVKANSCLAVLRLLRELGAGCDIVSGGELFRVLEAGFAPEQIVFSGVGKSPEELARACRVGVGQINIESLEELDALDREAAAYADRPVPVAIRVNPDVTVETHPYTRTAMAAAKFGVPADQVVEAAQRIAANPRLLLCGLAMHVGSQVLDPAPFEKGARRLAELVSELRALGITTLRSLDIGGGLGIRYHDEIPLAPRRLADALRPILAPLGLTVYIEPGRYLVGSAGILLTTVLYRKHSGGTDFVIVDGGMNDLVRPSHYQAYHEIVVAQERGGIPQPVDIVGPICETGDFLALGRSLPPVEAGDVLAVLGAGAYGFVMSSNYNDRRRATELMVDGGEVRIARKRESYEDLVRGEQ